MLTATYDGDRTMRFQEVPVAPPGPGEVQIEVSCVGICGTDMHVLHGAMDHRVGPPAVIGHEMSGRIAEVGQGVDPGRVGENLSVVPLSPDGTCPACLAGNEHICQDLVVVGVDSPGGMQGRWNVPAEIVLMFPPGPSLRAGALTEPVSVAVHDIRRAELQKDDRVVVLGGGPIGVLIGLLARHESAGVVLSEPDPNRRSRAAALGLDVADPPRRTSPTGSRGGPTAQAPRRSRGPMLERGRGKIILTASLLSFQGGVNVPGHAAAKSGVAGLTTTLANEWAGKGVDVDAVAPGYVATDDTAALRADPDRSRSILDRIPAGRWGRSSDLAGATVASPASDYVAGTVLPGDGGRLDR